MIDLKNNPRVIAKWLRRCVEDPDEPDRCHRCPYGIYASGDQELNCMDELHRAAAGMIERQNRLTKEV